MITTSGNLCFSNIRERIKETEKFKSLSSLNKKMFLSYSNVKSINHELKVIKNIGFDEWFRISNYRPNSVEVIQELINE